MPLLDWLNKDSATKAAAKSAYRLLEEIPELSYGDKDSENLIIQGDNLEALKALLPFYAGKVKCIYIDPPFNTRQAFDNYDDNLENATWLSLIYPRIELLNQLLSTDGTFFLHLDDNQIAYAIVVCDEIFGRDNRVFLSTFKQSAASGPKAANPGVVSTASYIVCYAKSKNNWFSKKLFVPADRDDRYNKFISSKKSLGMTDGCETEEWEICNLREQFAKYSKVDVNQLKEKYKDKYEESLHQFVLAHCDYVIRTARVADKDVGEKAKLALENSRKNEGKVYRADRDGKPSQYFWRGEQVAFYSSKSKTINNVFTTVKPLTDIWDDLLSNNLHKEGDVQFKKSKKPEGLIMRVIEMSTNEGDLVLDSFLGSGTTAAVAHKMNRRYIGIEMGDHAQTHCQARLQKVVDGEQGGISKAVNWQGGGGFRFCKLGPTVFDEFGVLNSEIKFATLAAHIWYIETHLPLGQKKRSPLIGVHNGTAYYLLYNGILGDKRPAGGNVLTGNILAMLPPFDGPKVIYGETTRLGEARLKQEKITFKQIPYDVKAL
jgi:adenine-specific DNA-methyltransferase